MVHTNPEFEKLRILILDLEFHQHLGSLKHVINIIMWVRDMGCYSTHIHFPNHKVSLSPSVKSLVMFSFMSCHISFSFSSSSWAFLISASERRLYFYCHGCIIYCHQIKISNFLVQF
jgi:hypothetical protein